MVGGWVGLRKQGSRVRPAPYRDPFGKKIKRSKNLLVGK
nr:MAG TPA: hypothetical protein [Caudoviricetes sp.]